jgi:hypothetical protein
LSLAFHLLSASSHSMMLPRMPFKSGRVWHIDTQPSVAYDGYGMSGT